MALFNDAGNNRLLAAMPQSAWLRWWPRLEAVDLPLGEVLYEPGQPITHVVFPVSAVVSLLYVLRGGASAEIALVGNEGMAGISLFMGGESVPLRAVVQSPGRGLRLKAQFVREEFERDGLVLQLLLRHTQLLLTQMGQTLACGRHHSLQQQLCRWLLQSLDRLPQQRSLLVLPLDMVARMLGADVDAVAEQMLALQHDGLLHCEQGRVAVKDHGGLVARCCGCYALMRDESDRLLGRRNGAGFVRH